MYKPGMLFCFSAMIIIVSFLGCVSIPASNPLKNVKLSFRIEKHEVKQVAAANGTVYRYPLTFSIDNQSRLVIAVEAFSFTIQDQTVKEGVIVITEKDRSKVDKLLKKTIILESERPVYSLLLELPVQAEGQAAELSIDVRYSTGNKDVIRTLSVKGVL